MIINNHLEDIESRLGDEHRTPTIQKANWQYISAALRGVLCLVPISWT